MSEFPEHAWEPWKFSKSPKGYWAHLSKAPMGDAVRQAVLRMYITESTTSNGSVPNLNPTSEYRLHQIPDISHLLSPRPPNTTTSASAEGTRRFPAHSLEEWFNSPELRRKYLEFTLSKLNSARGQGSGALWSGNGLSGAYSLSKSNLLQTGGHNFVRAYRNYSPLGIMTEFPEHAWKRWRFRMAHTRPWWKRVVVQAKGNDPIAQQSLREFINDVEQTFGLVKPEARPDSVSKATGIGRIGLTSVGCRIGIASVLLILALHISEC